MATARFPFFLDLPTIELAFFARRAETPLVRRLLVDSGFTGESAFILSVDDCEHLRRRSAPARQVCGALSGTYKRAWVKCSLPELGLVTNLIAIPADLASFSLPVGVQGLVGLSFLKRLVRWGGERSAPNE